MSEGFRILLVSGSTRRASTNTALLRTAQSEAPGGVTAVLYERMTALPHFDPDDDTDRPQPEVARLRAEVAAAGAVLFCTPEYAGALPGSFKNLLDWTVGGPEMYRKPVAWVNASTSTGAPGAYDSLATVLGYVNATIVEAACTRIPVPRAALDASGLVSDPDIRRRLRGVLAVLAREASRDGEAPPPGRAAPEDFSIRPMRPGDWGAVRRIYEAGIAAGHATFDTEAPAWAAWDGTHLVEHRLVAVAGTGVVGWVALTPFSERPAYAGVAEVSVYVEPGWQGMGVGSRMLAALVASARDGGLWTLQAGIFPENRASVVLHQRCGFRVVGRRERLGRLGGQWRDVLLLERRSPSLTRSAG